jgi:hypothetical protein
VQTRRRLQTDLAYVGAAGLGAVGLSSLSGSGQSHASEQPLEITSIRLAKARAVWPSRAESDVIGSKKVIALFDRADWAGRWQIICER